MKDSKSFCGVGDFPTLIPYSQLVKMVEMANKFEAMEGRLGRLEKQHGALRQQYTELVEKFGELRKML